MAENSEETKVEAPEEAAAEETEVKKKKATKAAAPAEAKGEKKSGVDEIIDAIKKMTVLDLSQLVKALEAEFGVTAAAPMVAAAPAAAEAGAGAEAAAAAEEQTEFTVILKEIGANKINVIKAVRELTSLGLKESKDLVESAPSPVREGVNKDEAAQIKQKLEAAGATAEIK